MKKVFGSVFLLTFVCQIGWGEPFFEIGAYTDAQNPGVKGGTFSDNFISPATMKKALETFPGLSNGKRLFYVSTDGYVVVGEDLPPELGEEFKPQAGDLIVNGSLTVMGTIYTPDLSASGKAEIKLLRQEVDALKKEIKLLSAIK